MRTRPSGKRVRRRRVADGDDGHARRRLGRELRRPAGATSCSSRRRVTPCRRPTRNIVCPANGPEAELSRSSCLFRHTLQARPVRCRRACAPHRFASLRLSLLGRGGLRLGGLPASCSARAAGGRSALPPPSASRLRFSASMMLTTLLGAGVSCTAKASPACLALQHAHHRLLIAVGELVRLEMPGLALDDDLGDAQHVLGQLRRRRCRRNTRASCRTS